jgi:hypothetical protein
MKSEILAFTLVATIVLTAADSPFMGRWKLNIDKSDGGDISVSFEGTAFGEMRVSGCCLATGTFRFDEKDYPADFGIIVPGTKLMPTPGNRSTSGTGPWPTGIA